MRRNFGSHPHLRVSRRDEALLQFDLGAVPSGVAITRASLKLFINGANGEGSVEVHRVLAPWDEAMVTYRSFQQRFARDLAGAFESDSTNTLKTVDVTSLVTAWTSGAQPNYGVLLRPGPDHPGVGAEWDEDNDPTIFVSSEGHNVAKRPALEVCYTSVTVDPCAAQPCQNGGTCSATADGYTCACPAGYTGTNCEVDINECASNPCQNGGTCADGVGSYSCTCLPGFSGANCETDIDECARNPCQNDGVCQDGVASYTCVCANGYDGTNCEHQIDNCASNPCHNGGTCANGVGTYTCTCAAGFEGTNCDINTDDCVANECQNGATCIDGIDSYTCACAPDWGGQFCDVNLNMCELQPCLNGGACTNTFGSYFCTCANGYAGTNCEVDIDDCTPNPCLNGATCVDGVASFTCHCTAGFSGTNCEIPDPALTLTDANLARGAGFDVAGANFTPGDVAQVFVDNILGCVVPIGADGSFHTTSCFTSMSGSPFRYFPDGAHTLTVVDGHGLTQYAQVTYTGSALTVTGIAEDAIPFTMSATNIEGTAVTDWWIAGRHTPVSAWGRSFQQQITLADLELGLLATGTNSIAVRSLLADGNVEQLVGTFDSMEPSVAVDPATAAMGDTVHVTAQGFKPNTSLSFGFGDGRATSVTTDANGHLDFMFTVPFGTNQSLYAGTTQLFRLSGSTGTQSVRLATPLAVTGGPAPQLAATPVAIGYWGITAVVITGSGFTPADPLFNVRSATVEFNDQTMISGTIDTSGNLAAVAFPIDPDNMVGHYPWQINVIENSSAKLRGSYALGVNRPTVTVDTSTARLGDTVNATVTNTNPLSHNLKVYVDDILVSSTATAGQPVPIAITRNLRAGAQHTVSVVDPNLGSGSGLTHASTQLAVSAPAVSAGVSSNADGTQVSVQGTGWQAGQPVAVTIDQQTLGNVTVAADGTWSLTATASLPPAMHTVLAASNDGVEKAAAQVATHR